ncbi:DUF4345 domain-containing protein [Arthrobacter pityocampae]|uniref:DUF4345 domain-containing protein n=1 Tax=Arthrobacter pityocampae TaxID=547334 RepID=UPI0011B0B105|nr:DUF4345 domain-containing protein [Arthrobacter pityocampae]
MTSNSPEHDNLSSSGGATPRTSGAASETPGAGAPRAGAPRTGTPRAETPRTGTPGTETPGAGAPGKGGKAGRSASTGGDWNVFRTVVVLVGLALAAFGAYYLILGTAGLPDTEGTPVNPTLESQFRFYSAMMVGVGAAFITIAIKFQWANMLWLVCLMVFMGGIGRVLSWAFSGTPNYLMIILMVIELAFPAALLVWHKYIAKTTELRKEFARRS